MPYGTTGSNKSSATSSPSSADTADLGKHFKRLPTHQEWRDAYLAASAYFLDPTNNPNTQYLVFDPKDSKGALKHTFLYVFKTEGNAMYCLTDKSKAPNQDKINPQDTFVAISRDGTLTTLDLASLTRPNIGLMTSPQNIHEVDLSHFATLSKFVTTHASGKNKAPELSNDQRLLIGIQYCLTLHRLHTANIPHGNITPSTLFVQQLKPQVFNVATSDPRTAKDFHTKQTVGTATDDIRALGKVFEGTLNLHATDVREMSSPSSANRPTAIQVASSLLRELRPDTVTNPSLTGVRAEILREKLLEATKKTVEEYVIELRAQHAPADATKNKHNTLLMWGIESHDNKAWQKERYDKHEPLLAQLKIILEQANDLTNVELAQEFRARLLNNDEVSAFRSASHILQTLVLYLTNDTVYPDTALMILGQQLNELERAGKIAAQAYASGATTIARPNEELPVLPARRNKG